MSRSRAASWYDTRSVKNKGDENSRQRERGRERERKDERGQKKWDVLAATAEPAVATPGTVMENWKNPLSDPVEIPDGKSRLYGNNKTKQ